MSDPFYNAASAASHIKSQPLGTKDSAGGIDRETGVRFTKTSDNSIIIHNPAEVSSDALGKFISERTPTNGKELQIKYPRNNNEYASLSIAGSKKEDNQNTLELLILKKDDQLSEVLDTGRIDQLVKSGVDEKDIRKYLYKCGREKNEDGAAKIGLLASQLLLLSDDKGLKTRLVTTLIDIAKDESLNQTSRGAATFALREYFRHTQSFIPTMENYQYLKELLKNLPVKSNCSEKDRPYVVLRWSILNSIANMAEQLDNNELKVDIYTRLKKESASGTTIAGFKGAIDKKIQSMEDNNPNLKKITLK